MFGITIDDRPEAPVAKPPVRRAVAIHWSWTTEYTNSEIARALGVTERTVENYLSEGPTEAVQEQMDGVEAEVRMAAVAELKDQLKRAGSRSRTAEKPVEVWTDDDGDVFVKTERDEYGEIIDRYPIARDYELMPDEEARFYSRTEVRDILEQLVDLVGAGEPEQHEITGEGGGPIEIEVTNNIISTNDVDDS